MALRLCLFATSAEMSQIPFVVRLLEGSFEAICERALAWGYDGIEFFPDPEDVADPTELERAASASGCLVPVIDTGLMLPRGLTLLDPDPGRTSADSPGRLNPIHHRHLDIHQDEIRGQRRRQPYRFAAVPGAPDYLEPTIRGQQHTESRDEEVVVLHNQDSPPSPF